MTPFSTLLWIHPFLIVGLSYLAFRYLPLRKARLIAYAVFLLTAFVMDLFSLSFSNDHIDIILQRVMFFMLAEYLWSLSMIRRAKNVRIAAVIVTLAVVGCTWRWIVAGPNGAAKMWNVRTDGTYATPSASYVLKNRYVPETKEHSRWYILSQPLPGLPLEKRIDDWVTAEGYSATNFSYKWLPTGKGVKLDLIDGSTVIWSMGEGL